MTQERHREVASPPPRAHHGRRAAKLTHLAYGVTAGVALLALTVGALLPSRERASGLVLTDVLEPGVVSTLDLEAAEGLAPDEGWLGPTEMIRLVEAEGVPRVPSIRVFGSLHACGQALRSAQAEAEGVYACMAPSAVAVLQDRLDEVIVRDVPLNPAIQPLMMAS